MNQFLLPELTKRLTEANERIAKLPESIKKLNTLAVHLVKNITFLYYQLTTPRFFNTI